MIEVTGLTKRYGRRTVVDGLSFTVRPGLVTGFLGPNGAGKTTTLRIALALETADAGSALIGGAPYGPRRRPMRDVGALLDAGDVQGGRTARAHLGCLARANGIGTIRVAEVLEDVGLAAAADRRIGGFSLGMRQRLGIAAALLGDPGVLIFDEPLNGLDPEGIRWFRGLARAMAAEGRTVLVSSHLMNEMALTADHVVVIGRGRLIADTTTGALTDRFLRTTLVRSPDPGLPGLLRAHGGSVTDEGGALAVSGLGAAAIGELAQANGVVLHELSPRSASLEEAFAELTGASVEYGAAEYRPEESGAEEFGVAR